MKNFITLVLIFSVINVSAQFLDKLSKKAQKTSEPATERKVEQKATKTTNNAIDGVLDGNLPNPGTQKYPKSKNIVANSSDFVPGNTIIFEDNFAGDALGDFPLNWFTNSSGQLVTFDNDGTKWLQISDKGSFTPLNLTKLPDNFTFEFDVTTSPNFNYYSSPLGVIFTQKTAKIDNVWNPVFKRQEAVIFNIHPTNSLSGKGKSVVSVISEKKEIIKNDVDIPLFNKNNNTVRVQVWRQKTRFRMYVDGQKYWDLPTAFSDANYNQVIFFIGAYKKPVDKYFISKLRLAQAGADNRHKLIETGSFTTNEILFDTNQATIKLSSKTVLDELGKALADNSQVQISITGHTDNDGNAANNQKLSEQRAQSVKNYLFKNFNISNSRMVVMGKGATEQVSTTKAENRRVEFKVL